LKVPLSWLADYVDVTLPADEIAHRLTMAGTEIGGITRTGGSWDLVSVGQVVGLEPHPNADRLRLATVDAGAGERHTVVCGAPNIAVGQKIAFARVGAKLIDGHTGDPSTLKAAKIRGIASAGMVCSEKELGLSDEHEGILVLPSSSPIGVPLSEVLGDTVLEAEVTPNRPDCLSILGIARELAAVTGRKWRDPDASYEEEGPKIESLTRVEVRDPDLCPRYFVTVVTGITIGPSPDWMQERLLSVGMRPINNVVDITNYVMMETGQPIHAFDLDRLAGRRIIVRRSKPGEPITTLYGDTYALDGEVLCVCDGKEPVTLGGILGATKAEVSGSTRNVLIEVACFAPSGIRHTVKTLGQNVHTEAAVRNERGLSPEMTRPTGLRTTKLLVEICGGKAAKGQIDVYPGKQKETRVTATAERLERVLGQALPVPRVRQVLSSLGFSVRWSADRYTVKPPYWRSDIHHADDIAEEVARVTGYDQLPVSMLSGAMPEHRPSPVLELRERARDAMAALGFTEAINYSVTTRRALVRTIGEAAVTDAEPIRLLNPMTTDREVMRTSLRPGMLETLASNTRRASAVRLFEIGRVYRPREGDLPDEREILMAALSGSRVDRWGRPTGERLDFFDLKGAVEALFDGLGYEPTFETADEYGFLDGRTARVVVAGLKVGAIGQVHPNVAAAFDLAVEALAAEIDLTSLSGLSAARRRYSPPPRFPSVEEDLAVVVDATVEAGRLARTVAKHPLVREARIFDVYVGGSIPAGRKSVAIAISYQAPDSTLTDEAVARARDQIVARLRNEFKAELRTEKSGA
jgi:phenylalanyl-tRNA synthetase beta chain